MQVQRCMEQLSQLHCSFVWQTVTFVCLHPWGCRRACLIIPWAREELCRGPGGAHEGSREQLMDSGTGGACPTLTSAEDDALIWNLVLGLKAGAIPALVPELVLALMDGNLDPLDG